MRYGTLCFFSVLDSENLLRLPNFIKPENYKKYFEIFEKMYKCYSLGTDFNEIMIQSLTLELIHNLLSDSKKTNGYKNMKENSYTAISNAITYVNENITSDLSLENIANHVGFSSIHFHKIFKRAVGKTLHEYVEDQRIRKAANMLVTTDYTLTKIAYECGFSSQSYFSYAFKRKTKKTPGEYKKEIFKNYENT